MTLLFSVLFRLSVIILALRTVAQATTIVVTWFKEVRHGRTRVQAYGCV